MTLLFVIGLAVWMIAHGVPAPAAPIMYILGGILVLRSPFVSA